MTFIPLDEFAAQLRDRKYSKDTTRSYRNRIEHWLRFCANSEFDRTRVDLSSYFDHLRESLTPERTVTLTAAAVRAYLRMSGKLFDGIPELKYMPADVDTLWTASELAAFLSAATTMRDKAILVLLGWCGLKVHESQKVLARDITPSTSHVGHNFRDRHCLVPLNKEARRILLEHKRQAKPTKWLVEGRLEGKQIARRTIQLAMRRVGSRADVGDRLTPESLRATFAVRRLEAGVPTAEVARELGFKTARSMEPYLQAVNSGRSS